MPPNIQEVDITTVVAGILSIAFAYASVVGNARAWVSGSFVLFGIVLILWGVQRGYRSRPTASEART
ncbi:hypothetical protein [Haloplanus salinarum]|uniref:hypothetical protein n=1 Tax=Haloplanus salinarum TaxID=1912324 RepID=UPI00214B498C|nr:hypothetical protein [Haloplanus salinarum]